MASGKTQRTARADEACKIDRRRGHHAKALNKMKDEDEGEEEEEEGEGEEEDSNSHTIIYEEPPGGQERTHTLAASQLSESDSSDERQTTRRGGGERGERGDDDDGEKTSGVEHDGACDCSSYDDDAWMHLKTSHGRFSGQVEGVCYRRRRLFQGVCDLNHVFIEAHWE